MSKEKEILKLIQMNPFISQQEIADQVDLSRPAVANYIKRLIDQGEIIGRAYVLNEKNSITCIGGANIDRKALSKQKVKLGSSNPVYTEETLGGVARNVAENLTRLGIHTKLLSFVGQDREGQSMIEASKQLGIDMSLTTIIPDERTGTYTALLDPNGEMIVSLADMDIYEKITVGMIEARWQQITTSKAIFVDTNISEEALHFIIEKSTSNDAFLFVDPVSSAKASKLPSDLTSVHTILPNKEEAEILSGISIETEDDYIHAATEIQKRGVSNVVITLGADGIFYKTKDDSGILSPIATNVVDVTGAGDAFAASLIYGIVEGLSFVEACQYGLAGSSLTLQSKQSVSNDMSVEKLKQIVKEFNI